MAEGHSHEGAVAPPGKNYEMAPVEFNRSIQTDGSYKQSYYGLGVISDYQESSTIPVSTMKKRSI
jgi:hypothetical protein